MALSQITGPDFICIGMPKAGTAWLYDQLRYHPDFWMPPIKELAYLSQPYVHIMSTQKRLEHLEKPERRDKYTRWANRRENDTRDFDFLNEAANQVGQRRDLEFYISLFRYKEGALSGDISTGYCLLNHKVIKALARRLPDVKILLLVRDPVARTWSQISMWHRTGHLTNELLRDPEALRVFLADPESSDLPESITKTALRFQRSSSPSKIIRHWKRYAPNLPLRAFLLDDIVEKPEETRQDVLAYLGADPEKPSGELAAGHNKKAGGNKLEFDEQTKAVLVEYFRDELRTCAGLFGERAKAWCTQYGIQV